MSLVLAHQPGLVLALDRPGQTLMKLNHIPKRAWINQPSSLQPWHNWHGKRVLAVQYGPNDDAGMVFPVEGNIESARMPAKHLICLSPGWPRNAKA